jgi:hypothetical protein
MNSSEPWFQVQVNGMNDKKELKPAIFSKVMELSRPEPAGICLNMIVKNEKAVLERLFQSVAPVIDYFVIVDTGSTQGTPDFILELAQRIDLKRNHRVY